MSYSLVPTVTTGYAWTAAMHNTYWRDNFAASPSAVVDAAGQLVSGTGVDACTKLAIGTTGQTLEADSSQASGLKWSWGFVPVGGIILWAGSIGTIPTGWHLVDATGGTIGFTDKFPLGAGSTYSVGDKGGTSSQDWEHTHTVTLQSDSHDHTFSTGSTGAGTSHTHTLDIQAFGSTIYITGGGGSILSRDDTNHSHTVNMSSESSHTHTVGTMNTEPHTHTYSWYDDLSGSKDIRPPYHALAYIQRVS